jgi:hypothetical protein
MYATYMSSRGDMKISLREITFAIVSRWTAIFRAEWTYIFMLEMLQELQFSVCSLGQDRSAEGLHYLFNGNILTRKQIFGRAT